MSTTVAELRDLTIVAGAGHPATGLAPRANVNHDREPPRRKRAAADLLGVKLNDKPPLTRASERHGRASFYDKAIDESFTDFDLPPKQVAEPPSD